MVILELSFPAGRYHATPWGRHVNEGAVEWPPSPWRVVRALVATWHLKAREKIPQPTIRSLLDKFSQPPNFHLPQAVAFHTRHYMPLIEGRNKKTTKIFDTFIQLHPGEPILVQWNISLSAEEMDALSMLASCLGYFGRAESLVLARLRNEMLKDVNALPLSDGDRLPEKHESVRLLCPLVPDDYEQWRTDFLAKLAKPTERKKQGTRKSAKDASELSLPSDLFEAIHADTGSLQKAGWNLPPGAKFVTYSRPENALAPAPRQRILRSAKPPTVARFTVVSAVPPRITKAISVANRIHDKLCSLSDQGQGPALVFRGQDEARNPLIGHNHAHIFCEANGPRDIVSHITIWAPDGFDENAQLALRRLNQTWGNKGYDLRLVLHGIGHPGDFKDCSLFQSHRRWHSLTPFVSTRHEKCFRDGRPKINPTNGWQIGSAADDLLRLLALNPKIVGGSIQQQHKFILINKRKLHCLQFQTIRHEGGGSRGTAVGTSFSIEFPDKVSGPLALGYGSHFGLGLFVPNE